MNEIEAIAARRAEEKRRAEGQELERRRVNGHDPERSFVGRTEDGWYGPLALGDRENAERVGEACGLEVVAHGPTEAMRGLMAANGVESR